MIQHSTAYTLPTNPAQKTPPSLRTRQNRMSDRQRFVCIVQAPVCPAGLFHLSFIHSLFPHKSWDKLQATIKQQAVNQQPPPSNRQADALANTEIVYTVQRTPGGPSTTPYMCIPDRPPGCGHTGTQGHTSLDCHLCPWLEPEAAIASATAAAGVDWRMCTTMTHSSHH